LIDTDRLGKADLAAHLFEDLNHIGTAEGKPRFDRGEKRENVSTIVSTRSLRPVTSRSWMRRRWPTTGHGAASPSRGRLGVLLRNCRPISRYNR
jgi:hypothetical protein